ncbi:MAG: hypothetical protein CMH07_01610 [Marinovum sp.]|nr:hypothetical protein [Marinovum sp.]
MQEYKSAFTALSQELMAAKRPTEMVKAGSPLYSYYESEFLPRLEKGSREAQELDQFCQIQTFRYTYSTTILLKTRHQWAAKTK